MQWGIEGPAPLSLSTLSQEALRKHVCPQAMGYSGLGAAASTAVSSGAFLVSRSAKSQESQKKSANHKQWDTEDSQQQPTSQGLAALSLSTDSQETLRKHAHPQAMGHWKFAVQRLPAVQGPAALSLHTKSINYKGSLHEQKQCSCRQRHPNEQDGHYTAKTAKGRNKRLHTQVRLCALKEIQIKNRISNQQAR
eukprot:1160247-Pelagomonas_calceolata.AAC.18